MSVRELQWSGLLVGLRTFDLYIQLLYSGSMAKKFLLYIHNPIFEAEKRKSALVNRLLNEYYKHRTKKLL